MARLARSRPFPQVTYAHSAASCLLRNSGADGVIDRGGNNYAHGPGQLWNPGLAATSGRGSMQQSSRGRPAVAALDSARMTLVRPTNHEGAHRGAQELSPQRAAPPANTDFPHHPTLSEVAIRQREIESWEALNVGGYRWARPGTIIGFLACAVMVLLALTPIPPNWPWNIPLVILAIPTAVATVVCGLLWFENPSIGPRPESLEIVPFSRAENLHKMQRQAVEPYQASCVCPGCGDSSTHRIRGPIDGEPSWATVTRQCAVCKREWAQA